MKLKLSEIAWMNMILLQQQLKKLKDISYKSVEKFLSFKLKKIFLLKSPHISIIPKNKLNHAVIKLYFNS